MRRFIVGLLAVIGLISLIVMLGLGGLAWWGYRQLRQPAELPDRAILRLALEGSIGDTEEASPLRRLMSGRRAELRPVIEALDQAARDPRITGVLADLSGARP